MVKVLEGTDLHHYPHRTRSIEVLIVFDRIYKARERRYKRNGTPIGVIEGRQVYQILEDIYNWPSPATFYVIVAHLTRLGYLDEQYNYEGLFQKKAYLPTLRANRLMKKLRINISLVSARFRRAVL